MILQTVISQVNYLRHQYIKIIQSAIFTAYSIFIEKFDQNMATIMSDETTVQVGLNMPCQVVCLDSMFIIFHELETLQYKFYFCRLILLRRLSYFFLDRALSLLVWVKN